MKAFLIKHLGIIGLILVVISGSLSGFGQGNKQDIQTKYDEVKNLVDIARYQWYDLYEKGVMVRSVEAGELLDQAKMLLVKTPIGGMDGVATIDAMGKA